MARYIDADELCKKEEGFANAYFKEFGPCSDIDFYHSFINDIEDQKTEDVAPVVHAHWDFKRTFGFENIYACSRCGRVLRCSLPQDKAEKEYPYCHCGAKMGEEEK